MVNWQSVSGYVPINKRDAIVLILFAAVLALPVLLNQAPLNIEEFPQALDLRLREPMDAFQSWAMRNQLTHPMFTLFFDPISDVIDFGIRIFETFLLWLPWQVIGSWKNG